MSDIIPRTVHQVLLGFLTKEISGGLPPSQTIALGNFGWPKANKIDGKLGRLRPTVDFKEFLFNPAMSRMKAKGI